MLTKNVSFLFPIDVGSHDVMSHIGWGGEQNTLYKNEETFP